MGENINRAPRRWTTGLLLACFAATLPYSGRTGASALEPTGVWEARSFGSAPVPPMGWNSWNAFHTQIDEEKLRGSAQAIVDSGLRDLGYRYINIDDGWWQKRRQPDGRMVIRTDIFPSAKVPNGGDSSFRPLVDWLHANGFKAGIYTDIGRNACSEGYPQPDSLLPSGSVAEREVGLYGHVAQDLTLYFQTWGMDYIKVDGCGLNAFSADKPAVQSGEYRAFPALVVPDSVNQTQIGAIRRLYGEVRDELTRLRPSMNFVLSICNWGTANVRAWGRDYGNLWRTSDDIEPTWSRMLYNFDSVATRELYSGPGHWNDPDMLYVGQGDFDAQHLTEARTHFALWAIEDAPLILGLDLRHAPKAVFDILGASEVIGVNQDAAGNQGVIAYTSDDLLIIVKQLNKREDKAVLIFNRGTEALTAELTAAHLKFDPNSAVQVRDLWLRRDLPAFIGQTQVSLGARESLFLRVSGRPELNDGMYLSEMPARLYVAADGIEALQADPEIHRPVNMGDGTTRGTGPRPALAGWGAPRADATPYDNELRLRGKSYRSGIGALAGSRLQIKADAAFDVFSAQVGIDDSSLERRTQVRFEVYGDGRMLKRSPWLTASSAPFVLHCRLARAAVVELVAREKGIRQAPTVVTWGDAALSH